MQVWKDTDLRIEKQNQHQTSLIITICQVWILNYNTSTIHNCLCKGQISFSSCSECIPYFFLESEKMKEQEIKQKTFNKQSTCKVGLTESKTIYKYI